MNTSQTGFFAQQEGEGEHFKDAFAPPPSRPLSKPWERALVSAHAPRLHGRKIWKRSGLRSQAGDSNKENVDTAQAELEKEGAGARKKARVLGAKQNIADAPWHARANEEGVSDVGGVISPVKGDGQTGFGGLLVPRKRTNANHLITPKGRSRRIPLGVLEGPVGSPKGMQETRLSGAESNLNVSHESPRKIPLNDSATNFSPQGPLRRRKSLRKSTSRRLTWTAIEEQDFTAVGGPGAGSFQTESAAKGAVVLEETKEIAEILVQDQIVDHAKSLEEPSRIREIILPETDLSAVESIMRDDSPVNQSPVPQKNLAEMTEVTEQATETIIMSDESAIQPEAGEDALGDAQGEASTIQDTRQPSGTVLTTKEEGPETSVEECLKEAVTFTPASMAPASEEPCAAVPSSPTKAPRTPRRGKRSNSQERVVKRITRSTSTNKTLPAINVPGVVQPLDTTAGLAENASPEKPPNPQDQATVDLDELTQVPEIVEPSEEDKNCFQTLEQESQIPSPVKVDTSDAILLEDTKESEADSVADCKYVCIQVSLICEIPEEVERETSEALEVAQPEIQTISSSDDVEEANSTSMPVFDPETTSTTLEISKVQFDTSLVIPLSNEVSLASPNSTSSADIELEKFDPVSVAAIAESILDKPAPEFEEQQESAIPDPSTTSLVETICENAPATSYNEDDTDLLRNFLTRVKANKEAQANSNKTKRKRSLPHSPIKLPLGSDETHLCPSPPQSNIDFDVSLPAPSPTKRRKRGESPASKDDKTEPQSIRRSGRTRLPVKTAIPAPSFIPVRRLGLDGDNTITLRQNEEKELAALTKFNTRKNKGNAVPALDVLERLGTQKEDPATRHRALKQKYDEKTTQDKNLKKRKSVVWAEEIAQYQSADGKILGVQEKETQKEKEQPLPTEKKSIPVRATSDGKKSAAVRVGVRSSRISLGMVANGTPAPKRRTKGDRS